MKKLLSILICLSMLISLVPMASGAESSSQQNALELFGFPLDPDSYDTKALKKGTYPIAPKYDLYVDNYSSIQKYTGTKTVTDTVASSTISKSATYTTKENVPYSVATGFSASGTGVKDHIAKAYFPYGRRGANICLSVYDANGNALVTGFETGGYVTTEQDIEMWELEGLLSITSGDFDGDGYDEIAVYTPNSAADLEYGKISVAVGIFEFDLKTKTLSIKQYIDLPSKRTADEVCEWEYANHGETKQFYCHPYVALSANDLNHDGIDDLAAIVNFSTWFRGEPTVKSYTTAQVLDYNTRFASVLEAYEGTQDGNLKQVIRHRVLATTPLSGGSPDSPSTEHRYLLRNANITVGDVTKEGSQEIIIAGNYTRTSVKNTSDNSTTVATHRLVEVDGESALCHIVGYTTYDNLKNHNTYDLNSDYKWTVQNSGNGWTYWYNEDTTDSGPITTSLCAFKYKGTGKPDTIFVGGQLFDYNGEEGKVKFTSNYNGKGKLYHGTNGKKRTTSVVWIGGSVAGNFSNDKYGREMLVFPFYLKVKGEEQYTCKLLTQAEQTGNSANGGSSTPIYSTNYSFEDAGQRLVSLAVLDGGGKTSYITYPGDDTEVYFSDIQVLSIMQAPPLYEELEDDDYIGNSSTSFEKSKSTSSGTTNSGSFSIGPVIGMEYNAKFLGIIPCGGAEYEFSIVGSVSHEQSTEKTYSYATGFETSGTTDAVTVFTVPYVRYNCEIYMPEYTLPTESDYNTLCAFRDELTKNLENCLKTGEEQISGTYVNGCKYYEYKYSSYVSSDNYQEQLSVLKKVTEEIKFIEEGIVSFGKGGTGKWGETVADSISPYTYSMPQTPMMVTVDVDTYDKIAEFTPGLEKIYGNVFPEHYRAGDPNTYAKTVGELRADGKVIQSQMSDSQMDGYLSNNSSSTAGTVQSQSISIEESESSSIGWGIAIENTSLAIASVVKVGFTASLEHSTSYVTTTTEGHTYSGTQVAMPEFATSNYGYDWKLVAYNAKLNGAKVPVVGYMVKNVKTPPSVAQNIAVKDITGNSATLTWEDGDRPADYYKLSTVYTANDGKEYTMTIDENITSENGCYSYTIKDLKANETTHYILESYMNDGNCSVPTQPITVTTFPDNFSASINVSGMENSVIYSNGKAFDLTANVSGNEGYTTYYQWELDSGNGWENITGQNKKDFKFTISPLDNGKKLRCTAVIRISSDSAYTLYSEPIVMNCARTDGDYQVDWEDNKIKITKADTAEAVMAYIRVLDSNGAIVDIIAVNGEADLSEYMNKGYNLRLFLWKENFAPATLPFEG